MDVEKEKIKKNVLDDEIIDRVKKGDKEAFNMLIRIYQQKIFKLAYCYLQNREDAMEIVQETFLRVYQKIKQFKKGSNFRNWIYRITSNLCVDYHRKFHKEKIKFQIKEITNFHSQKDESKILDLKEILKKSLKSLSHRQRTVFIMRHYQGLKCHEISAILNISVGTVKSLNYRAIKKLQNNINKLLQEKQ